MSDLSPSPVTSKRLPELSDKELWSWYADLLVPDEQDDYEPHVPPPVEPDIKLLREAYEEVWREEEGGREGRQRAWGDWAVQAAQLVEGVQEAAKQAAQAAQLAEGVQEAAKQAAQAATQAPTQAARQAVVQAAQQAVVAQAAQQAAVAQAATQAVAQAVQLTAAVPLEEELLHLRRQSFRHRAAHRLGMTH